MQHTTSRAARVLGVGDPADRAEVRRAFRAALRRERPDLGGMSPERLAQLMAARDVLLAAAQASVRPPSGPRPAPPAGPAGAAGPSGPHARRFYVTATPVTGRLVDLYA